MLGVNEDAAPFQVHVRRHALAPCCEGCGGRCHLTASDGWSWWIGRRAACGRLACWCHTSAVGAVPRDGSKSGAVTAGRPWSKRARPWGTRLPGRGKPMAATAAAMGRGGPTAKAALRVLGRSEGVEEGPVGFAGVEQGSDSVVVEVGESEGGAFDAFDQVVGCFGGGVGDSGGVPVGDLGSPGGDGAPEPVDLFGHARFLEVGGELGDGGGADFGAGDVIDAAQGLFGVPGVADLAVGVP